MKDIMFHIVVCCVIDFRRAEKPHLELLLLFNDFFSPTQNNVLDQSEAGRGLFKKRDDKIGMDYECICHWNGGDLCPPAATECAEPLLLVSGQVLIIILTWIQ